MSLSDMGKYSILRLNNHSLTHIHSLTHSHPLFLLLDTNKTLHVILASFVAAVLKDGTMADLKRENNELRALVEDRLLIHITGPQGTPIYYEGSLKNGSSPDSGMLWNFFLENPLSISLHLLALMEIRVGGIVVHRFDINTITSDRFIPTPGNINLINNSPTTGRMFFQSHHSPMLCMYARINFSRREIVHLPRIMELAQVVALHQHGKVQDLIITGFTFKKSEISGCISLLEKLGISSSYDEEIPMFTGNNKDEDNEYDDCDCDCDDDDDDDNDNFGLLYHI